jgi:cytochrome c peroxidase
MRLQLLSILLIIVSVLTSCRVDPPVIEPAPVNELKEIIPEGWPQPVYRFTNNPISKSSFELGRALFYEPMLSRDNTISCGSCHQNFAAFANSDHKVSHGIDNKTGNRNSPAIFNLAWHPSFMHDGGINHIEVQPLGPIANPIEMDEDINNVIAKLAASERYRKLFSDAYGSEEVNTQRIMRSMAQFMGLIYSYNSKYDRYKRQEKDIQLTAEELRGYELFLANCNSCHKEPLFSDFGFRNNGLSVNPAVVDSGRARITQNSNDLYRFKTPSLRNVAFTAPYMHDGRYNTLDECLDHYTSSVTNKINLDPLLQNNGLQLNGQQKSDIISFLHTLSDFQFINDKRYADPNFR